MNTNATSDGALLEMLLRIDVGLANIFRRIETMVSVDPVATCVSGRKFLEYLLRHLDNSMGTKRETLFEQIGRLNEMGVLPRLPAQWAHALRKSGNIASHADAHEEEVNFDDAREVADLAGKLARWLVGRTSTQKGDLNMGQAQIGMTEASSQDRDLDDDDDDDEDEDEEDDDEGEFEEQEKYIARSEGEVFRRLRILEIMFWYVGADGAVVYVSEGKYGDYGLLRWRVETGVSEHVELNKLISRNNVAVEFINRVSTKNVVGTINDGDVECDITLIPYVIGISNMIWKIDDILLRPIPLSEITNIDLDEGQVPAFTECVTYMMNKLPNSR